MLLRSGAGGGRDPTCAPYLIFFCNFLNCFPFPPAWFLSGPGRPIPHSVLVGLSAPGHAGEAPSYPGYHLELPQPQSETQKLCWELINAVVCKPNVCSFLLASPQVHRQDIMLGINKGGRDEGCAGGCTRLSKIFCQLRCISRLVYICLNSSPDFLVVSVLTSLQKFSERLLLALALLQYCCVVKHDVS